MKNLLIATITVLAFAACQNSGQSGTDNTASEPAATAGTSCYIRAEGPDTTFVNLTIAGDGTVSGTYDWVPYEKDSARGTLSGKQEGELIRVVYDYMIEGSHQQQEMVMKLTGGQLSEGEGELEEGEGGLLKLKDPSNLVFRPFTKVACK